MGEEMIAPLWDYTADGFAEELRRRLVGAKLIAVEFAEGKGYRLVFDNGYLLNLDLVGFPEEWDIFIAKR